jgi:hypothetical protein
MCEINLTAVTGDLGPRFSDSWFQGWLSIPHANSRDMPNSSSGWRTRWVTVILLRLRTNAAIKLIQIDISSL